MKPRTKASKTMLQRVINLTKTYIKGLKDTTSKYIPQHWIFSGDVIFREKYPYTVTKDTNLARIHLWLIDLFLSQLIGPCVPVCCGWRQPGRTCETGGPRPQPPRPPPPPPPHSPALHAAVAAPRALATSTTTTTMIFGNGMGGCKKDWQKFDSSISGRLHRSARGKVPAAMKRKSTPGHWSIRCWPHRWTRIRDCTRSPYITINQSLRVVPWR